MELSSPLVLGFVGSFFLLGLLTLTAFVKISTVSLILRNALGLQQVPSNMVLMVLALFLAIFISLPVISQSSTAILEMGNDLATITDMLNLWEAAISPYKAFLARNTDPEHIDFFIKSSAEVWRGYDFIATEDNIVVQVPAFLISELTEAFEMGFLLYLPFVAVDLAVTGILMALGMQNVQPNIIATPFKLLIFVMVDGWSKLVSGLVLSYGIF